jgi:hypothetical protein
MTNIKVPEGMLEAGYEAMNCFGVKWESVDGENQKYYRVFLSAALKWQSENAPRPTEMQMSHMLLDRWKSSAEMFYSLALCQEWVRIMWPEEEPEQPDLTDLLKKVVRGPLVQDFSYTDINNALLEAYRRGQKSICAK